MLFLTLLFIAGFEVFASASQTDTKNEDALSVWLKVIDEAYSSQNLRDQNAYQWISNRFFDLYIETDKTEYLNFALHEAGRNQREIIVDKFKSKDIIYDLLPDHAYKLLDNVIVEDYFAIREFSSSDIYRFLRLEIPNNQKENAELLLNYWFEKLPETYEKSEVLGSFKAQAIIHGFDRLDDFNKVLEVSSYLTENNIFPPSLFSINLFETISYSARVLGYYQLALQINEKILQPVTEALGNTSEYLTVRMDYATTLFRIGNLSNALNEYEFIYQEDFMSLDSRYRAALFNNLAISYLNAGEFDRYVQFQLNAFEIASNEKNYSQQLSILRNLFIYYRRQNDTELAFNYLNQALQLARENELNTDIASILVSLGIYKKSVESEYDEALRHFYDALYLSAEANNYQHHYMSYVEIGETYLVINDLGKAEEYFIHAMDLASSRDDALNYLQAAIRYANMLTVEERFEEAERLLSGFSERDFIQLNFNIRVLANNVKVRLLKQQENYEQAIQLSTPIISETINWLRESSDQQTGHMRMDDEFTEAFKLHTLLMHETGQYYKALAAIGELRNISRAGFFNNPLLKSQVLSEEELIEDYNLSVRIQQLRNRYQQATEEQRIYLGNELLNTISERNMLQTRAFPNYNERQYEQLFSRIRRNLRSDQIIFYFSVFEDDIFRFTLSRSGISMKSFSADGKHLDILRKGLDTIGYGTTDLHSLYDIYAAFFEGDIPSGINHIYMIPDAEFYRLPLEILPIQRSNAPSSYGSAKYLIEEYSVSYANSLSELLQDPSVDSSNFTFDIAGFGIENFRDAGHPSLPNLPFSPKEIEQSAQELEAFSKSVFYLGSQSTEHNFRDIAGNSKILHLATHSKINDENPLFSTLYLFADTLNSNQIAQNDGMIHAYELFDMNLNAELIFLSSCESGAGGYLQGAGILGFSRAFSYAGAKSLSMNLWPVRDQTASEISVNFYRHLNSGANKAESLRQARLTYLNNVNSDPYLWGSFVLFGNIDSPIPQSAIMANLFFLSLGFVIVFGGVFIVLFSRKEESTDL